MEIDVLSAVSGAPPPRRIKDLLRRAANALRKSELRGPKSEAELSILFCGDSRMRRLNRRYRGTNRSTDVLAFPGEGKALGDIVISVPYAGRQARRRKEPRSREIDRLLLHGYLHLLGYDHETDEGEMEVLEARLRRRLGLASPEAPRSSRKTA
jgi:probable rRNA maturation factor